MLLMILLTVAAGSTVSDTAALVDQSVLHLMANDNKFFTWCIILTSSNAYSSPKIMPKYFFTSILVLFICLKFIQFFYYLQM